MQKLTLTNEHTQFLIYKSDNQDIKVDVLIQDEDIWLTMVNYRADGISFW